jgi:hypothetical protein
MVTKTIPKLSLKTLKTCSNRTSLEREFKRHKISIEQRISFLKKAMGNPVMSYSSGYPSVEDRYEVAIGAYLSGVWKRNYSSFNAMENKNAS